MNWAHGAHTALIVLLSFCPTAEAALSWTNGAGFRSADVRPAVGGKAGFSLLNPQNTGVWFTNVLEGDAFLTNAVAHNGAGVAIGDVDGDDWPDIYLCSLQGPNRLYRNLGNWRFQEQHPGDAACADQFSTGAAFADVDGDNDLDLLVNGIGAGTRLFLNDGKGQWTEAASSGLSRTASPTSIALADIDGDGDLDIYCAHYIDVMHLADPTTRFAMARRDGQWTVTKVNDQSTRLPRWKDRFEALPDGRVRELPEADGLYRNDGQGKFTAIQFEPSVFSSAEGTAIPPYRDWGLAVMFRDINGDRAPDLYVCNDNASPDRVWINSGRGTFRLIDPMSFRHTSRSSMGVDFADVDRDGHDDIIVLDMLARDHGKRMTQLVKDHSDRQSRERVDGQPRYNRNTLFFRRSDGSYIEAALMAGVAATDWSWCPVFVDVDLDGYEDLLVTNGFAFDVMDQDSHDQLRQRRLAYDQAKRSRQFHPSWPTRNAAFRNRGDGTFEWMNEVWGFDQMGISYGAALGDLDNDGDLDVVVNNLNAAASVYRNDSAARRIAVRLKGLPPNTHGIGARVEIVGSSVPQSQEIICGGRYMSSDQSVRVFAAPAHAETPMRIEVAWRNGARSVVTDAVPNRIYEIEEKEGGEFNAQRSTFNAQRSKGETTDNGQRTTDQSQMENGKSKMFTDLSHLLNHRHVDENFDDWARQPLLPKRLSETGPGVSWYDVNADGWDDLIVAAGRGGKMAVYMNDSGQRFRMLEGFPQVTMDQGAVVGWPDGKGNRHLLAAISNDERTLEQESEIAAYSRSNIAAPQRWPAGKASLGPLALADIDGDGDLDVFVGGRFLRGKYPEPVSSGLWLNEDGHLRPSGALSEPFRSLGMVSGATFGDLDGDGDPDLALALDWGPLRIFRNERAQFQAWNAPVHSVNQTIDEAQRSTLDARRSTLDAQRSTLDAQRSTLNAQTGLWTSVACGDFDGDGRIDLAAGNWGRNTSYALYGRTQLRVYYGDWNRDGTVEIIEAWHSAGKWLPVRDRTFLARGLPELSLRFPSHRAYGVATVEEILGASHENAQFLEAAHFESTVFLNRGSHFESLPLPREAQLSPVFSMNVGDFDGDGIEDLFLSQNFFGTASGLSRDDAGRGLWLRGNGRGTFTAIDASVTGLNVPGEQRGAALADFDRDGRVDVAVSQNGGPTKMYRNQRAKRGLRVALNGPATNPDGVGAQLRVVYANGRKGPSRTVQAGSGYWSQDGAAQVLGLAESPVALWIRWPEGREQTVPLKEHEWDLRIQQ